MSTLKKKLIFPAVLNAFWKVIYGLKSTHLGLQLILSFVYRLSYLAIIEEMFLLES